MTIGLHLKEERTRLGYNQADFAALAQTTKKSQIEYEKGATFPNAAYLAAVAQAGADVQYIVTGVRSSMALTPEERLLVDRYRESPRELRDAALRVLLGGEGQKPAPRYTVDFGGAQIGQASGGNIVNKAGRGKA